jgi:hypothetical protein
VWVQAKARQAADTVKSCTTEWEKRVQDARVALASANTKIEVRVASLLMLQCGHALSLVRCSCRWCRWQGIDVQLRGARARVESNHSELLRVRSSTDWSRMLEVQSSVRGVPCEPLSHRAASRGVWGQEEESKLREAQDRVTAAEASQASGSVVDELRAADYRVVELRCVATRADASRGGRACPTCVHAANNVVFRKAKQSKEAAVERLRGQQTRVLELEAKRKQVVDQEAQLRDKYGLLKPKLMQVLGRTPNPRELRGEVERMERRRKVELAAADEEASRASGVLSGLDGQLKSSVQLRDKLKVRRRS